MKDITDIFEEQMQSICKIVADVSEEDIQKVVDTFASLPNINYIPPDEIDAVRRKLENV